MGLRYRCSEALTGILQVGGQERVVTPGVDWGGTLGSIAQLVTKQPYLGSLRFPLHKERSKNRRRMDIDKMRSNEMDAI